MPIPKNLIIVLFWYNLLLKKHDIQKNMYPLRGWLATLAICVEPLLNENLITVLCALRDVERSLPRTYIGHCSRYPLEKNMYILSLYVYLGHSRGFGRPDIVFFDSVIGA